jgi:hypothetical protein
MRAFNGLLVDIIGSFFVRVDKKCLPDRNIRGDGSKGGNRRGGTGSDPGHSRLKVFMA